MCWCSADAEQYVAPTGWCSGGVPRRAPLIPCSALSVAFLPFYDPLLFLEVPLFAVVEVLEGLAEQVQVAALGVE